jgi:hypothetical protein
MEGGCLCGDVRWRTQGSLRFASHCHCSRCRKAHGTAYGTYAAAEERDFSLHGEAARYESSPGFGRRFCARCGSVTPGDADGALRFVPLGGADGDTGTRPEAHIFVASRAPWFTPTDALPRFDAYPPGIDAAVLASPPRTAAAPGTIRGSCLCGGVAFELREPPTFARFCHCSRCRKGRAAAFASNLFASDSALRWARGAEQLVSFKLPDAKFFTQCFCRVCGGKLPRIDPDRKLAVVPMGSLDDDPGIRPREHIFTASRAAWDEITDGLPQHPEAPA